MAIRRLAAFSQLEVEAQYSVDQAYRRVLRSLCLANDHADPLCEYIARKVLEVSERDVTSTIAISKIALRELELNGNT
jgi:hypothetical protein